MPKYHFEARGGVDRAIRAEADLDDFRAAQIEAVRALGELLADNGAEFWSAGDLTMSVADDAGVVLFTLNLSAS